MDWQSARHAVRTFLSAAQLIPVARAMNPTESGGAGLFGAVPEDERALARLQALRTKQARQQRTAATTVNKGVRSRSLKSAITAAVWLHAGAASAAATEWSGVGFFAVYACGT
jgi:hypothetical protein